MAKVKQGHISIKWYAWLAIGAFVAIYAQIVKHQTDEPGPMTLFFWIGLILMVIGAGKFLLRSRMKEEQRAIGQEERRYDKQLHQQQQQRTPQGQQQQQAQRHHPYQHPQSQNILVCPSCHTKNYATSAMCFRCGVRLR